MRHAFQRIYAEEGVRGFYKGLLPSMFGIVHVAVQMPAYESLKTTLARRRGLDDVDDLKVIDIVAASIVSKFAGCAIAYPHEVVRTKLQRQRAGKIAIYDGVAHCVRSIVAEEGVRGLYRGLGTTLLRVVPAAAVTFVTIELVRSVL
jgi:solute carrier family 25 folate transporter 32